MISDELYNLCEPILQDSNIEDEEKTDKIKELLQERTSLSGQPLEEKVLSVLWRHRESKYPTLPSSPVRQNIIRRSSPAPWQVSRVSTPSASPSLGRASPIPVPGQGFSRPSFLRKRSYGGSSNFSSPRPSPRLAFASPIPHSPSLDSYDFSNQIVEGEEYGSFENDSVDWLVNEEPTSRPSSSGAGSIVESSLNAAAASWIQPQQNDMSPYDMLRSVMGNDKSEEEIETVLEANGYDLSSALMSLMSSQEDYQQDNSYLAHNQGQVLIGKSMAPSHSTTIDPNDRTRSTTVCKYWLTNGNCLRADCRFSHDLSGHICKYWLMGNCLAGDACIFSHDPSLLLNRMNIGDAAVGTPPPDIHPSLQIQDYDNFPSLRPETVDRTPSAANSFPSAGVSSYGSSSDFIHSPRRQYDTRAFQMNGMNSSFESVGPRPSSRHRPRETTPAPLIPAVDDTEAFPSLGTAGIKLNKKHHGKRGGHGHGHGNKENSPNLLSDVVRISSAPASNLARKNFMKRGNPTVGRDDTKPSAAIPAPKHVPWLETGAKANQDYVKARQEAFKHGGLRNRFLQSAAQAWNRSDARAAKALSLRGQAENDAMRRAHREAARILYEERNKDSSSSHETYVDLHGLHPDEAIEYLERALIENQKSHKPLYAITGTGHHSKNGKDKIGKAVRTWLIDWRYAFREFSVSGDSQNPGGILGIDPGSFNKSLLTDRLEEIYETEKKAGESTGKIQIMKNPAVVQPG